MLKQKLSVLYDMIIRSSKMVFSKKLMELIMLLLFIMVMAIKLTTPAFAEEATWDIHYTHSELYTEPYMQGTILFYDISVSVSGKIKMISPMGKCQDVNMFNINPKGFLHTFVLEEMGNYQIEEEYTLTFSYLEKQENYTYKDVWLYYNARPNFTLFRMEDTYIDSYSYELIPNDTLELGSISPSVLKLGEVGRLEIEVLRDINPNNPVSVLATFDAKWHKFSSLMPTNELIVSGLVYVNDLFTLTSGQFSKILNCAEIKYILTQIILNPNIFSGSESELERSRIVELAKAGKHIIIQIWFGPGKWYNWSYCSYPNIAMQQEVRDYLFPVIDRVIDQIGPENIYGMHLLEEDGHFGVDIDQPGNWWMNKEWVYSGKEDGNPYTNFNNLRAIYGGPSDWCHKVPNVAQYNPDFKSETSLDMNDFPANSPHSVLDRWMARRLWGGAHRAFFHHLKNKYPNIHRFIWGNIAVPWNGTEVGNLWDIVDGVVADSYDNTLSVHHLLSGLKALLPNAEHLVILKGSPNVNEKYINVATAYMNGASGIGFFDDAYADAELWYDNTEIWKRLSELPVIRSVEHRVLVFTGNTDSGYSTSKRMLPFFRRPTVITMRDAAGFDFSGYKIIVLHNTTTFRNDLQYSNYGMIGYGPDDQAMKNWVQAGGVLIITAPMFLEDSQFFVSEEGIAWTRNNWYWQAKKPDDIFRSCVAQSIARKYNLKDQNAEQSCYSLMTNIRDIVIGKNIFYDILPFNSLVIEYGQGKIVILPIFHCDSILIDGKTTEEYRNEWQIKMANYIADVVRGVALLHDPSGMLSKEVIPSGEPFGLEWASEENNITIKTVFDIFGQTFSSEIRKSGECILCSEN